MASSSLDELLEMVRNLSIDAEAEPTLQVTRNTDHTDPPSRETVNDGVELEEEDALRALILNLEATKPLSIEVKITEVNEFSGLATLSIPKVSFVKTQIEQRKPHFVGISEVKNKGDRGAEGEIQLLELLSDKGFGYLSAQFDDEKEFLIHGWDERKYKIADSNSNNRKVKVKNGPGKTDGSWGYGHRYIWTRLVSVSRDDETETFILVTCHMSKKDPELVKSSWRDLMEFIGRQKGVPILLMGDTNRPWAVPYDFRPSTALRLQDVLGLNPVTDPPNPYPHLALDDGNPATTMPTTPQGRGSYIDNFIFFYKDGEKHDHFQKNYRVHYHKLGWTSHHVLVFEFNERLLT